MSKDDERRGSDNIEKCSKWGAPPQERDLDDKEHGVQRLLSYDVFTHLHWFRGEPIDEGKAYDEPCDSNKKPSIRKNCVNRESDDDNAVVAGEVSRVIRHTSDSVIDIFGA